MAKWADYLISGVWKADGGITHVFAHQDSDTTFGVGKKTTEADIIRLLKQGLTFCTIRWNYQTASWAQGARVTYENLYGRERLRTVKDATVSDNLDNLINMATFF